MGVSMGCIDEKLIAAIRRSVAKPYASRDITSETEIVNELGIDSLSLMTLSVELENSFGVDISSNLEGLLAVVTVSDLQTYIETIRG